jgi:hypothetical protein
MASGAEPEVGERIAMPKWGRVHRDIPYYFVKCQDPVSLNLEFAFLAIP